MVAPSVRSGSIPECVLPEWRTPRPDEVLELLELRIALERVIAQLKPRLRRVIELRYGWGCDPLTLREAGEQLGVNTERARQLQMQAERSLRRAARRELLAEYVVDD